MDKTWELVQDEKAHLGESPSWDSEGQVLYWIDSARGNLYIYDPKNERNRKMEIGEHIGSVAPKNEQEVIMATESGIYLFHLETEKKTFITNPNKHSENIFNDGKCDPFGRFWVGTVNGVDAEKFTGELFCLQLDYSIATKIQSVGCSNGITWSPDYQTMYYIDTLAYKIVAFDYDLNTGDINNKRTVVIIPEKFKLPDGMSGDMEGNLWVAHWDAGVICCWDPNNRNLLETIKLPVPRVTSCVFGGEKRNELYVTSARTGLTEKELASHPYSGGLFRINMDVQGLPTFSFNNR
ncbi:SMP-30/gluconolactonase/LRE family protein [Oceanobacillus oncorhynchi]|uniref:SMP-30/gluconolactonase/LRE family protein n=1 Tax=Oceanobacillus oncorhynchi TaxID=545501 RepID=UPI002F961EBB